MNKLLLALLLLTLGNIVTWFQFQGQFWSDKLIFKSYYFIMLVGMPISILFWYATKFSYEHFGQYWNIRLMGFGAGTFVFGIMTWLLQNEIPTMKTLICLLLAAAIVLIQITNVVE
jgi:hypothetical protein|tara:strand:+ start:173 stop:520 length:348 start_codon:yes stop_codon:yes gene_type:complete